MTPKRRKKRASVWQAIYGPDGIPDPEEFSDACDLLMSDGLVVRSGDDAFLTDKGLAFRRLSEFMLSGEIRTMDSLHAKAHALRRDAALRDARKAGRAGR